MLSSLLVLGFVAGLGSLVLRALTRFTFGGPLLGPFDSDMAIPVLMANAPGHGLFDAYYWGQDRSGAWPFLLARLAGRVVGQAWTAQGLQHLVTTVALGAGLPLLVLSRRAGAVAAGALALTAVAQPAVSGFLGCGHPYAWQLLVLCATWGALRLQLEGGGGAGWRLGALLGLAFLGAWTTPASGPQLLAVLAVELAGWRGPTPWRERLGRAVPAGLALVGGSVAERVLRGRYHVAARRAFGHDFRTEMGLDSGHLLENVRGLASSWASGGVWPVLVVVLVGAGAFVLLRARAGRGVEAAAPAGWAALRLAAGAAAMAGTNFALLAAVVHVRVNGYGARYLAPTHVFLAVAAALCVLAGLEALLAHPRLRPWRLVHAPAPLLVLGLLGGAHLALPAPAMSAEQLRLEETARMLAGTGRPLLLLGGYWDTYVYAALAPPGTLLPLPVDRDYQRNPFDKGRLAEADVVVLNHAGLEPGPDAAPSLLVQHGVLLRLVRAASPREGFSLYVPVGREALPLQPRPALEAWDLCAPAARAALRFESSGPVTVLVHSQGVRPGAAPPSAALAGRALPVDVLPDLYRIRVDVPVAQDDPLELGARAGLPVDAPGCRVQGAWVLRGAD